MAQLEPQGGRRPPGELVDPVEEDGRVGRRRRVSGPLRGPQGSRRRRSPLRHKRHEPHRQPPVDEPQLELRVRQRQGRPQRRVEPRHHYVVDDHPTPSVQQLRAPDGAGPSGHGRSFCPSQSPRGWIRTCGSPGPGRGQDSPPRSCAGPVRGRQGHQGPSRHEGGGGGGGGSSACSWRALPGSCGPPGAAHRRHRGPGETSERKARRAGLPPEARRAEEEERASGGGRRRGLPSSLELARVGALGGRVFVEATAAPREVGRPRREATQFPPRAGRGPGLGLGLVARSRPRGPSARGRRGARGPAGTGAAARDPHPRGARRSRASGSRAGQITPDEGGLTRRRGRRRRRQGPGSRTLVPAPGERPAATSATASRPEGAAAGPAGGRARVRPPAEGLDLYAGGGAGGGTGGAGDGVQPSRRRRW